MVGAKAGRTSAEDLSTGGTSGIFAGFETAFDPGGSTIGVIS